jgi:hypothetical protein
LTYVRVLREERCGYDPSILHRFLDPAGRRGISTVESWLIECSVCHKFHHVNDFESHVCFISVKKIRLRRDEWGDGYG